MLKSIAFKPETLAAQHLAGRLPPAVSYRLPHAISASWLHPDFWLAEQYHDGKHAYADLVEVHTRVPLALPISALRQDLFWLYLLRGELTIRPSDGDTTAQLFSLQQGHYAPLFAGRGDYTLIVSPGRIRLLLLVAQLKWMKRYEASTFSPIRHLLQGQETGFVAGEPRTIRARHLRILAHLLRIAQAPSFRHDVALYDHLADLFGHYLAEITPATASGEANLQPAEESLNAITRFIQAEIAKGNTPALQDLYNAFGLSEKGLYNLFIRALDIAPGQYIHRLRLGEAHRLLAVEGWRPTAVAYHLGYDHLRTFERAFKRHFGRTPSEARHSG